MFAHCGLGGRREDRSRQLAGVGQAFGQRDAAHGAVLLVFLPTAARQVAAHHGFYRNRLQAFHQHRTALHLGYLVRSHDALGRHAGQVVRAQVAEAVEPPQRHLRQQFALAGDRLAHDDVEGREPVAGDHQDAVGADSVVVAHLAACEQRQALDGGGMDGGHGRQSVERGGDRRDCALHTGRVSGA